LSASFENVDSTPSDPKGGSVAFSSGCIVLVDKTEVCHGFTGLRLIFQQFAIESILGEETVLVARVRSLSDTTGQLGMMLTMLGSGILPSLLQEQGERYMADLIAHNPEAKAFFVDMMRQHAPQLSDLLAKDALYNDQGWLGG